MKKDDKRTKQAVENTNYENLADGISSEQHELFKQAIFESIDIEIRRLLEETKDIKASPISRRHKIRVNRLFRERIGGPSIPFPEDDNLYERLRSRLVKKLKINEFLDRRKENEKDKKQRS